MATIEPPRYGYIMFLGTPMQGPFSPDQLEEAERTLTSWKCVNLACRLKWFNEPFDPMSVAMLNWVK